MKCANNGQAAVYSGPATGEWISDELPGWKCSNCGEHIVLDVFRYGKFCPNCGTPMRTDKAREQLAKVHVISIKKGESRERF